MPWWELFSVKTEELVEVVRTLHELYQRPKAEYIHVLKEPAPQPQRALALTPETTNADNSPAGPDSSNLNAAQQQLPTVTQSEGVTGATGTGRDGRPVDDGEATSTAHQARDEITEQAAAAADDLQAGASSKAHHRQNSRDGRDGDRGDRDRSRYHSSRSRSRSRDRGSGKRDRRDSHRDR